MKFSPRPNPNIDQVRIQQAYRQLELFCLRAFGRYPYQISLEGDETMAQTFLTAVKKEPQNGRQAIRYVNWLFEWKGWPERLEVPK